MFPPIIVQALSTGNTPVSGMVVYAQFSRIAGAAAPKFTTPLKFGKKLLRAVAVTNQMGQARFNLSTAIAGFAGAYDITFLTSFPANINLPVVKVLIATSVVSVTFEGPSMVVRTLLRPRNTIQSTFGYLISTTAAEMQSSDYATFFRLYFNLATDFNTAIPRYLVTATDARSNFVSAKLVEMVSEPANVLDLVADTTSIFGTFEPSFLPVTSSSTGSSELYLKLANPIPLSMWPQPPVQLHGINTARFYFVIDGIKSSSFVTVFLTPPVPPPPTPVSVIVSNMQKMASVLSVYQASDILSLICNATFNATYCAPQNTYSFGGSSYCVPSCPVSFSQLLPFWYQFILPLFHFVVMPNPIDRLSRVVGRAAVGGAPFALKYGVTTFDGSPVPESRLVVTQLRDLYFKRLRAAPVANSQSLKVVDLSSPTNGLTALSNNFHLVTASPFTLVSNVTYAKNEAILQCLAQPAFFSCYNSSSNIFAIAPASFTQSNNCISSPHQCLRLSLSLLQIFRILQAVPAPCLWMLPFRCMHLLTLQCCDEIAFVLIRSARYMNLSLNNLNSVQHRLGPLTPAICCRTGY